MFGRVDDVGVNGWCWGGFIVLGWVESVGMDCGTMCALDMSYAWLEGGAGGLAGTSICNQTISLKVIHLLMFFTSNSINICVLV